MDFGCSEEQITTEDISNRVQRASGCGQEDLYLHEFSQGRWIGLRDRAAFELSCDKKDLKITMFDTRTFGVTGCDQKAVYKVVDRAGYVLDTVSKKGEPPVRARRDPDEPERAAE